MCVTPASTLATPTSKKYSLAWDTGLRRGRRGENGCSSVPRSVSSRTRKYSRTVRAGTAASEASRSNTIGCPRLTALGGHSKPAISGQLKTGHFR